MRSALYRGSLVHTRRDHLRRTFRYPVFMAAIELDELPALDRELRLFSVDRANLFSLHASDYTTPIVREEQARDTRAIASNRLSTTSTTLVTNLRFAGYTFNPVSFFLRYAGEDLVSVIAEVNNTYGGRHCYELDPTNRITRTDAASPRASDGTARTASDVRVGFRTTRELFVSPFLHGPRVYEWWFPAKRDPERLAITMHLDVANEANGSDARACGEKDARIPGARIFTATFAGERRTLADRALASAAVRYPLNTAQVIGLIHLEAMKLRFLHREPYRRPGPDHRPLDV